MLPIVFRGYPVILPPIMKRTIARSGIMQVAAFLFVTCAAAQDWTRFRGPNGTGIAAGSGYPVAFDKTQNVIWRTPVRPGKSSPVLTGDHIFLTACERDQLFTQCFDRSTGKLVWERAEQRVWKEDVNGSITRPLSRQRPMVRTSTSFLKILA